MATHNQMSPPSVDLSGLMRGWKTILATTIGAMIAGAALIASITPQQAVSAKIIVEPRDVTIDGRAGATARDKEFLPTQAEVLQSPAVIAEAIQRIETDIAPELLTRRVGAVAENLKVDPLAGTGILLLRYTDMDAQTAADTVNALVASYSEYLGRTEKQQHQELLVALTNRDAELQAAVTQLHAEFEQLKQSHPETTGADSVAMARIIAALEESLATTQSRRIGLERAAERVHQQGQSLLTMAPAGVGITADSQPEPATRIINAKAVLSELAGLNNDGWTGIPNPTAIEDRLRLAKARVTELSQSLGPGHPELQAAQAVVTAAETELSHLVDTAPTILRQALENMRMQEQALQQRYDAHVQMSGASQIKRLKETRKLAEIDRAQHTYESIHEQLQQWQLVDEAMANGRAGIAVSVLEPPTPGERSFVASPIVVIGIAGLLGLSFGIFLLLTLPQIKNLLPLSPPPTAKWSPTN